MLKIFFCLILNSAEPKQTLKNTLTFQVPNELHLLWCERGLPWDVRGGRKKGTDELRLPAEPESLESNDFLVIRINH